MTDIKEKQNHFSNLKCLQFPGILINLLGRSTFFYLFHCGMDFPRTGVFQTFSMGRILFFFFVAGSYAFLAFPHFTIGRKSGRKGLTSR